MAALRSVYYSWHHGVVQRRNLNELRNRIRGRLPVVLVHQMGRAASMTMVNTIRDMGVGLPVFHTHWLNPATLKVRLAWARHDNRWRLPLNIRVSKTISEAFDGGPMGDYPWRIVTIIRDPVARNLSAYFLSIDRFIPDVYERYKSGDLRIQEIQENFLRQFPHNTPLEWFDVEVEKVFGIDVYDYSFSFDQGYTLIEQGAIKMAVIKVENLKNTYESALRHFFGRPPGPLRNTHISDKDQPPYSRIYRDFLAQSELPREYLERMYESKFARHFYSSAERTEFMKKWAGA